MMMVMFCRQCDWFRLKAAGSALRHSTHSDLKLVTRFLVTFVVITVVTIVTIVISLKSSKPLRTSLLSSIISVIVTQPQAPLITIVVINTCHQRHYHHHQGRVTIRPPMPSRASLPAPINPLPATQLLQLQVLDCVLMICIWILITKLKIINSQREKEIKDNQNQFSVGAIAAAGKQSPSIFQMCPSRPSRHYLSPFAISDICLIIIAFIGALIVQK